MPTPGPAASLGHSADEGRHRSPFKTCLTASDPQARTPPTAPTPQPQHYVTPSPNTKHQVLSGNLHFSIRAWLEQHPIGRVFYAPFDIVFT